MWTWDFLSWIRMGFFSKMQFPLNYFSKPIACRHSKPLHFLDNTTILTISPFLWIVQKTFELTPPSELLYNTMPSVFICCSIGFTEKSRCLSAPGSIANKAFILIHLMIWKSFLLGQFVVSLENQDKERHKKLKEFFVYLCMFYFSVRKIQPGKKYSFPEVVTAFILLHTHFEKSCISLNTGKPFYMSR